MHVIPHLLPGTSAIGFAGSVHSGLILSQVHQGGGQAAEIGNIVVKKFGCLVHLVIIATISHLRYKYEG